MIPIPIVRCNGTVLTRAGTLPSVYFALSTTLSFDVSNAASFASFAWTLVRQPAGSSVSLTSATGSTTGIAGGLDVPGEVWIRCVGTTSGGDARAIVVAAVFLTANRGIEIVDEVDIPTKRLRDKIVATQIAADNVASSDATKLRGRNIAATAPTNGQVYAYNLTNSDWEPVDIATSFASLSGRWSLSQVDNSSNTGTKFLRDDGTWQTVAVSQDFRTVANAAALPSSGIVAGNLAAVADDGSASPDLIVSLYSRTAAGTWEHAIKTQDFYTTNVYGDQGSLYNFFTGEFYGESKSGIVSLFIGNGTTTAATGVITPDVLAPGATTSIVIGGVSPFTSAEYATWLRGQVRFFNAAYATAGFVRTSSNGTLSTSALVAGDIPDISTTYATRAALTGTGYLKGAAGFVGFVTTVSVSELATGSTGFLRGNGTGVTVSAFALSDIPSGTGYLKGSGGAPAYTATVALADLANSGGTTGDILYWNGSNWVRLAAGTLGKALISTGTGAAPAWGTDFDVQDTITAGLTRSRSTAGSTKSESYVAQVEATTTDATVTTLWSITPPSDCAIRIYATTTAIKSDGSSSYGCDLVAQYRVSGGSVTAIQDGSPITPLGTLSIGNVVTDTSGGAIRLRITGIAATTIRWGSSITAVIRTTGA